MCGIGGWIEKNSRMRERFGVLNKMSDSLARRGPDENGIYVNGDAALIHRRLTVIERSCEMSLKRTAFTLEVTATPRLC